MPLAKLDKMLFVFLEGSVSAGSSKIFDNFSRYSNMVLEISGASAISLKVQGCINVKDANGDTIPDNNLEWSDIDLITAKNMGPASVASDNGIYYVSISGLTKVKVTATSSTGTIKVIGVMEA